MSGVDAATLMSHGESILNYQPKPEIDHAFEFYGNVDDIGNELRKEAYLKNKAQHSKTTGIIGLNDSWLEDGVSDAKAVAQYKKDWAEKGFPDVNPGNKSRAGMGHGNDPTWQTTPEYNLWHAVFLQAMQELRYMNDPAVTGLKRKAVNETRDWAFSPRHDEGSFLWICDILGLDATYIRAKISAGAINMKVGGRLVGRHYVSKKQRLSAAEIKPSAYKGGWYAESM